MTLRILLVDDHEVVRLGMKVLLDKHQGFSVVAEADTEDEAVEQAVQHEPDIVLMDIRLAGGSGIPQLMAAIDVSNDSANDRSWRFLNVRIIGVKIASSLATSSREATSGNRRPSGPRWALRNAVVAFVQNAGSGAVLQALALPLSAPDCAARR